MIDAFQMWVYEQPTAAADPSRCDAQWVVLEQRFMPSIDWSGFEQEQRTGWHRLNHIHTNPFYYIEYAIARLGALQLWANAQRNQAGAVAAYRAALALGNTVPLPELFTAAGIRFAFDSATLRDALDTVQQTVASLGESDVPAKRSLLTKSPTCILRTHPNIWYSVGNTSRFPHRGMSRVVAWEPYGRFDPVRRRYWGGDCTAVEMFPDRCYG